MSNVWDAIKPFVSKFAPMLGAAVGGPLGGVAGAIIQNALGPKDASPESISAAIKTGSLDGVQILALRQAEAEFALKMKELDIHSVEQMETLAAGDRDSARKREMEVKDWTPRILAYAITLGFFGLLWFLLKKEPPPGSRDILNIMLGSLGSAWIGVVSYYFGSSAGSAAKTEIIKNSTPTK